MARQQTCPHCHRRMRPAPLGASGRSACPLCHAELSPEGALLAPPAPGPRSLEDVLWDIHEGANRPAPPDEPDYRP